MTTKLIRPILKLLAPTLVAIALVAGPSLAADVTLTLTAEQRPVTMPDGTIHQMWGFFDATSGPNWAPGPRPMGLEAGDALTINLTNNLTVPVSIVIPGQTANDSTPVMVDDDQGRSRVRSFAPEAAANGGSAIYVWSNLKAGTFLYQSGTQPSLQVAMGLYGAVTVDVGPGEAYPGVAYDSEVLVLYSEVDPVQHAAATPTAATPLGYKPEYFLINGEPFDPNATPDPGPPIPAGEVGQNVLIRMLNAGLKSHFPMLYNGGYMDLVAEDGNPYPYPREQYSAHLPPGKTIDAIWMPTAETTYPLFDRSHHLTTGGEGGGGMLAHLQVGPDTGPGADTVTILRTRFGTNQGGQLRVWATSDGLTNCDPTDPVSLSLPDYPNALVVNKFVDTTILNGCYVSINANGVGSNPGAVTVESTGGGTDTEAVPFTEPPVAIGDAYATSEGDPANPVPLTIPAPGVLVNDLRGGWIFPVNGLKAVLGTPPTNGTLTLNDDGSFSYTHDGSETLFDSFTYRAQAININNSSELGLPSDETVVTITINPANDAPVASPDFASTDSDSPVVINVLDNDTDAEGDTLTITAVDPIGTSGGSVTTDGNTVTYDPATFTGTDSDTFNYTISDGNGGTATAGVTVTISANANLPPVTVNDFATITACTAEPCSTVTIDVLANDSDPDGTIDPTTVCVRLGNYPDSCTNFNPRITNSGGTVELELSGGTTPTGRVIYTPPLGYLGTDSFRYNVRDDNGAPAVEATNRAGVRVNVVQ